ncbi:MAG: hypothetical protein ACWA44_03685 [Thiotrichales bacterium]
MLRYLPGLVIVQLAAIALTLLFPTPATLEEWLRLLLVSSMVTVLVAFWFDALAKHASKDKIAKAAENFAKEREELRVKAEKEKTRVVKETQKQIAKETFKVNSRANLKVGAALTGVAGIGALLVFTQFMSLGLVALAGAGGGLAGYVTRVRQEHRKLTSSAGETRPRLKQVNAKLPSK